jgi:hypothetical protein
MKIVKPLRLIAMLAAGGIVLAATQVAFAQRVRDYRNPNADYSKVTPSKLDLSRAPGGRTVTTSPLSRAERAERLHQIIEKFGGFRSLWY